MRSSDEAAAYLRGAPSHPDLPRRLRRQHGGGLPPLRREHLAPCRRDAEEFGTKVEIKNMNSFRNVQHALDYEVKRQARALDGRRADRPGDAALGSRPGSRPCPCGPRSTRTTTDTSPSPTSRRSRSSRGGSTRSAPRCPSLPAARRAPLRPSVRALVLRRRPPDAGARTRGLLRGGGPRVWEAQDRGQLGAERAAPRDSRATTTRRSPPARSRRDTWPVCSR